jgi:hypothetical protein
VLFAAAMWPEVLAGVDGPVVVLAVSGLSVPQGHTVLERPGDAPGYAARLYAALREADALEPALIAIERPPGADAAETPARERALWAAVMDRVERATSR